MGLSTKRDCEKFWVPMVSAGVDIVALMLLTYKLIKERKKYNKLRELERDTTYYLHYFIIFLLTNTVLHTK